MDSSSHKDLLHPVLKINFKTNLLQHVFSYFNFDQFFCFIGYAFILR